MSAVLSDDAQDAVTGPPISMGGCGSRQEVAGRPGTGAPAGSPAAT